MKTSAEIKIEAENPKQVITALEPDIDKAPRFEVELVPSKDHIILKVNADDLTAMRAAVNSYLRLINTLNEVDKFE
ncbi:MAG: KEOPS complex subunit Pcc1 [Candidatus Undinarchaeales archaeon]